MYEKFSTIDGKLLTNVAVEIPQWINDIKFDKHIDSKINIDANSKVINSKIILAERDNMLADTREIKTSFNDKTMKSSAIAKLSNFLGSKRYSSTASVNDNKIDILVNFEQNPCDYKFTYNCVDGKIKNNDFFYTKVGNVSNEYSFNKAGLEDSFNEIKELKINEPTKVKQAACKFSKMTRIEIVRRCGGKLRTAQNAIEHQIKEGNIISIGSNEYASSFDLNYLFPDMREEYVPEDSHSFEFVDNKIEAGLNERKSNQRLSIESSNIISNVFNLNKVISANRDNSELLVKAEIVNNNVRDIYDFNFSLENEKINKLNYVEDKNNERYSVAQLLSKFGEKQSTVSKYLNNKDSKIASGYIMSKKNIHDKLSKFMNRDNIDKLITSWRKNECVTSLNNTTYASNKTFEELLSNTDVDILSNEEIKKISEAKAHFGKEIKFYKYNINDNDTRNKLAKNKIDKETNLIKKYIDNYLQNYSLIKLDNSNIVISLNNDQNKKRQLLAKIKYENDSIKNILCSINGDNVKLENIGVIFKNSDLLKEYLSNNKLNEHNKIIISKKMFYDKLSSLIPKNQIDEIIKSLINNSYLNEISNEKYASSRSFESLIKNCNFKPNENYKSQTLAKKDKTTLKILSKNYLINNDTRHAKCIIDEITAKSKIQKMLPDHIACSNFNDVKIDDSNENINFTIECFNKKTGITSNLKIASSIKNNDISNYKVLDCNGKEIDIEKAFNDNTISKNFNNIRNANNIKHNIVFSKIALKNSLSKITNVDNINDTISNWTKTGKINEINSNTFASKYTLNELLTLSNLSSYDDKMIKENIVKSRKLAEIIPKQFHVNDNDSRNIENIEDGRTKNKFTELKEKINIIANKAANNKKITANKLSKISNQLNLSNNELEIDKVWKDLKRYV